MPGLVWPIFEGMTLHAWRMLKDSNYRRLALFTSLIGRKERFTPCSVSMGHTQLSIPDNASFLSTFEQIFVNQIYKFKSSRPDPRILDLGANIGLSILYFKQLYPAAHITALEPDPHIFSHLSANIHGNGLHDVSLVNAAAWTEECDLAFWSEGADGGRLLSGEDTACIRVKAVDVARLLREEEFDFLKIDIEGAETDVLSACRDSLSNIQHLFVEYHDSVGTNSGLQHILSVLYSAGFRYHIQSLEPASSVFLGTAARNGFNFQLNISAWRAR